VALAAAVVAIAAPSLRPELRAHLMTLFPDLSQETVDFLTGHDTDRLVVTFDGLDQRVTRLTETLNRLEGLDSVTPAQVRDLLLGETLTTRLDALDRDLANTTARVETLENHLTGLNQEQTRAAERMTTWEVALADRADAVTAALGDRIGTVRTAVGQVETSLTQSLDDLSARLEDQRIRLDAQANALQAREDADAAQETALSDLSTRLEGIGPDIQALQDSLAAVSTRLDTLTETDSGVSESLTTLDQSMERLSTTLQALDDRVTTLDETTRTLDSGLTTNREAADAAMMLLEDLATVVGTTQQRRALSEQPLLGVIVLRRALNGNGPYPAAWALARPLLERSPAATRDLLEVLERNATTGVRTLDDLRRDFRFIATQASKPIIPAADWSGSLSSWINYWFGDKTATVGQPNIRQRAMVDSIDGALEAGRLDLAIEEAVMLSTRTESALLSGWIADARQRQAVETAFATLESGVLDSAGAALAP